MATTANPRVSVSADNQLLGFSRLSHHDHTRELVVAIQQLSLARSLDQIQAIVRTSARRLTGADGATFVLRDADRCYYADEDAISPLWKGQRFPMSVCISGWAMLNRHPAVIEDIYADQRIPHDAYRPTFVKSLAMVPIRTLDPVGAIGNYWATRHQPTEREVELLQALADSTAVAMENVRVYSELEERVLDRTAELQARTDELEETNRTVRSLYGEASRNFDALRERNDHHLQVLRTLAHEVRTPLAAAQGILRLTLRDSDRFEPQALTDLRDVDTAVVEAIDIVSRQLEAARLEAGAVEVKLEDVDVASEVVALRAMFRALTRSHEVALIVEEPSTPIVLRTDRALLGHIMRNLVGNALKFTDSGDVRVHVDAPGEGHDGVVITVADTGIGIAPDDIERVFGEFVQVDGVQSARPAGSGLGLALVRRLAHALGGQITLESEVGRGSRFTVTLPPLPPRKASPQ